MKRELVVVLAATLFLTGCEVTTPTNDVTLDKQDFQNVAVSPAATTNPQDISLEKNTASEGATMKDISTVPAASQATITTHKGNMVVKLYPQDAPKTVANFISKAESGFYENLTFHRVEDWVIQGGDPDGNGTGGGTMPTELNAVPFKTGSLGVARGGDIKVSNDAQFFICTTDCAWLTGQYTNFGEVIEGMDVAKQIASGDRIISISYQ